MTIQLTCIVLTFNEAQNLSACLDSLRRLRCDLVVVDSGSEDDTIGIATALGARIFTHPFETHAKQWLWAFQNVGITTDWVLALDADQQVSEALAESIERFLEAPGRFEGAYVSRKQIFRGRWIRFGGYYPKLMLKMFHKDAVAVDLTDLVDHHFIVRGLTRILNGDLIEANLKEDSISVWIAKHNNYARLQAQQEFEARPRAIPARLFGSADEKSAWLKRLWAEIPIYVRPCAYFVYRYVLRFGFLDGKQGFLFHFLQGFWYRLLVDINIDEMRSRKRPSAAVEGG